MQNKIIQRENSATKIFNDRSLAVDYRTLVPLLRKGMRVLDVGCGTGSITNDIATITGHAIGIDNTEKFITAGKEHFKNIELQCVDLFEFNTGEKFDLIVSARTMQWLRNVDDALLKMKSLLKPGGVLSILDYNHTKVEWSPAPPASMKKFYNAFLKWREDAGMNNRVGDELPLLLKNAGFENIEIFNANEHYRRSEENFISRAGIWSKVAELKQIVDEGYSTEAERLQAIEEYDAWVASTAESMTMKLNEVRGVRN
jgi:ubiquinone/menaquinone biosynthesis C-methylase UbiE